MGTGGHNVPLVVTDDGFRKLTPRECFNFQGFPKSFKLPKDLANSHLYKQSGNSVTVPMISVLAKKIRQVIRP
jgi:DNA (cytosine-5)-methyltransferase 1